MALRQGAVFYKDILHQRPILGGSKVRDPEEVYQRLLANKNNTESEEYRLARIRSHYKVWEVTSKGLRFTDFIGERSYDLHDSFTPNLRPLTPEGEEVFAFKYPYSTNHDLLEKWYTFLENTYIAVTQMPAKYSGGLDLSFGISLFLQDQKTIRAWKMILSKNNMDLRNRISSNVNRLSTLILEPLEINDEEKCSDWVNYILDNLVDPDDKEKSWVTIHNASFTYPLSFK